VKRADKPQVQVQEKPENARPTIALERVLVSGTSSFSGWGPKVAGTPGNVLKSWN
jgi:hypothetical protein